MAKDFTPAVHQAIARVRAMPIVCDDAEIASYTSAVRHGRMDPLDLAVRMQHYGKTDGEIISHLIGLLPAGGGYAPFEP